MSGEQDPVLVRVEDGIGHVELNRPDASNAMDMPLTTGLRDALRRVAADDEVRVVLLTGRGRLFCAGGDLPAMTAAPDREAFLRELADALHEGVRVLDELDKPVVTGVQGAAAGAGFSLVLGSDLVVAGESASLVTAYAGVGLTPDGGQSWLLPRAVGLARALDLTLTSRRVGASEAHAWGIVTRVVPDEEVHEQARALARRLADGPAAALGRARRLLRDGAATADLSAHLDAEAASIAAASAHPDSVRLIDAFLAR